MFSFGESDEFTEKRREHLIEKQAIAKYVTDTFLHAYADRDDTWIFMDSGTATYTICEELVANALQVPVMTNNLASCRTLSVIPAYPLFVVPGEMETRYVASLGDECIAFVRDVMSSHSQKRPVQLALIAATSVTSNIGICGNDPRHNELKKTLLEKCPESLVVFEGEKLLHKNGVAIFKSRDNWRDFATQCNDDRTVRFITHYPENFSQVSLHQRKLFDTEIAKLKNMFGDDNVVVLGNEQANGV